MRYCHLKTLRSVLEAVFFFCLLGIQATADTLLVPGDYTTIQNAINAARSNDTIIVSPGIYLENLNYLGKAIEVRSEDPTDISVVSNTVIDGSGALSSDVEGSVVTFNHSEGNDSIIDGVTLTGGIGLLWNEPSEYRSGGGIFCRESSPSIRRCRIVNNQASAFGGGVRFEHGGNSILQKCTISNNTSDYGGGINISFGSVEIDDCLISDNVASSFGGGIALGIYTYSSADYVTVSNCTIENNVAEHGGGIFRDRIQASIENCIIRNNSTTTFHGGGLYVAGSNYFQAFNCIIANNTAEQYGGGIFFGVSDATFYNCTIVGNTANLLGGGIAVFGDNNDVIVPSISNTILWNNNSPSGKEIALATYFDEWLNETYLSYINISHSDVENGQGGILVESGSTLYWGGGNLQLNPMFIDADGEDNVLGTDDDNLRLAMESPCINTGSNVVVNTAFDIDGNSRILGSAVDMGAFEFQVDTSIPTVSVWGMVVMTLLMLTAGTIVLVRRQLYKPY